MTDDTFMENCYIGCSAPDIDQHDACFLFIFAQYRIRGGDGFKDELNHLKPGFPDTFVNVLCRCCLPDDNMEICLEKPAILAFWLGNSMFAVNAELLCDYIQYLFPGIHVQVVHAVAQFVNILLADLTVEILPDHAPPVLKAFDMLTCNPDIHILDVNA